MIKILLLSGLFGLFYDVEGLFFYFIQGQLTHICSSISDIGKHSVPHLYRRLNTFHVIIQVLLQGDPAVNTPRMLYFNQIRRIMNQISPRTSSYFIVL